MPPSGNGKKIPAFPKALLLPPGCKNVRKFLHYQTCLLYTSLQVQIGIGEDSVHRVTLVLKGEKKEEYNLIISLSGFFNIEKDTSVNNEMV